MPAPAIVMGDRITGTCPNHFIPGAFGVPQPVPAMPFSAPLTQSLSTTVQIGGKFAAVAGSSGLNTPPHPGLHPTDPFLTPPKQVGRIVMGSPTVLIDGRPAATQQSTCTCCVVPGTLVPSVTNVLIG